MTSPPRVLNKRRDKIPPDAILVDRTTKWGNPFPVSKLIPRAMAISLHQGYMKNNPTLYSQLEELRGKDLVYWCAPLPCHADILLELANEEANQ